MRISIMGASGKMGQSLLQALPKVPHLHLEAALVSLSSPLLGQALHMPFAAYHYQTLMGSMPPDVLIDFSSPAACTEVLSYCRAHQVPLVMGTTGLSAADHKALQETSAYIPIMYAENMSPAMQVYLELLAEASRRLATFDVEITDIHHRDKKDAPSGTAKKMGQVVAQARQTTLDKVAVWGRHGVDMTREPGQIGFHAIRAGSCVGEHRALLAGDLESIELIHCSFDRSVFALNALRAAERLLGRPPRLYSLQELFEMR